MRWQSLQKIREMHISIKVEQKMMMILSAYEPACRRDKSAKTKPSKYTQNITEKEVP